MLGEVVGRDEGQDMRLQACQVLIVEDLNRGVFDRPVHAFGLTVGPGMVRLGQTMLDPVLDADAVEDVRPEELPARPGSVLGQIGERHAVVGQHGVDLVGKSRHDVPEEGRSFHLARAVVELDVGELRNTVDGEEHDQLAVGVAQLAAVDMHVADVVGLEASARLRGLGCRKAGDAVPLQTAMQGRAAEARNRLAQATQDIVQRQQRPAPELDHDGLLGRRQDRARGRLRTHRRIARHRPSPPLGDRLRVQAVPGGQGAATFFRRLELGSNTRRRAGAAVKNSCHSASSP